MKLNQWTSGLAAAGVVSLASAVQAEEASNQLMTSLSSTTLSGYVDTSAIWNIGTGNAAMPGRAFDGAGKLDGFNLNVLNLTIEKPLDEGDWSAGYKAELVFGPDGAAYDGTGQHIKQAYVHLRAPIGNGLDIKMGVWDTIIGYEGFNSYANANYGRSFGWQLEPTQHTGVLLGYQFCDWLGASFGVANTWTPGAMVASGGAGGVRGETQKTYMASVTMSAPEDSGWMSGSALTIGAIDGFSGMTGGSVQDTTSLYAGLTVPTPVEGLSLGLAYDYRQDVGVAAPLAGETGDNWAWSLAAYLSYQATEKLALHARADYTHGSDGTWYDSMDSAGSIPGVKDNHNEMFAATLTADYKLWENVITRAELRWDHVMTNDRIYGGDAGGVRFRQGNTENALTLALNVIYRF